MNLRIVAPLLTALIVANVAAAQDDLPYYQEQRLVVIFNAPQDIEVSDPWSSGAVRVLDAGLYRFDASRKSQAILTDGTIADGSGPFVTYGSSMKGRVTPLGGGGASRDASVTLKMTEGDRAQENVLRAGELRVGFWTQISSMSSTEVRFEGDVKKNGSYVGGSLSKTFTTSTGSIEVLHIKLSVDDDHLPTPTPLDAFPELIEAVVTNAPVINHDLGRDIDAGPYGFELTRDAQNPWGQVDYESAAQFPMVNEWDYYGHYQSSPSGGQIVVRSDGDVWVRMGWSLSGRYHGWSYDMTAVLTPAEWSELKTKGFVAVTGKTTYSYGSEDGSTELETTAAFELTTGSFPPAVQDVTGRVRIRAGRVELSNPGRYRVDGMLTEALRALEGERVTATGVVTDGPPRRIKVESFSTELRSDARGIGGGSVVSLSAGTEVEVLRVWSRYARVRYDDGGSEREATIRLSAVVPTGAGGMLGILAGSNPSPGDHAASGPAPARWPRFVGWRLKLGAPSCRRMG